MPIDILAIAAHRDDVELTCGGTCSAVDQGHRTAILDLTGEVGTRAARTSGAGRPKRRPGSWA